MINLKLHKIIAGLIIVYSGFLFPVRSENILEQIGWEGATTKIILWLILVVIALLMILIGLYIRSQIKIKNDKSTISIKLFNEFCKKADLYPSEIIKLEHLLKHEFVPYHHEIFQSAALFERCMDVEIRLMLLTVNNPQLLDEDEKQLSSLRKKMGYSYLSFEQPLLSTRNIEIGQGLSIYGITGKTPLIEHAVVRLNRETFFRINYKDEKKENVRFIQGQEVKIVFARQGDGIYGICTEICNVEKELTVDCLHTLNFQRNQLRQFVRITVNLPLKVRILSFENKGNGEHLSKYVDTKLADISGGGLSFIHTTPFVPGDRLSMQFTLTTGKFTGVEGKVLRVSLIEGKTETFYRHHILFISIETNQRDKIVKFIFDKQRQLNQIR